MSTYAMICENRVIEVLYGLEVAPEWPPNLSGNPVTAVECDDNVQRGWIYNPETGEIIEPVFSEPEELPEPSKFDTIEESQLTIMEALADQYEENEERYLNNLEIQATIYEAILEQGGNA